MEFDWDDGNRDKNRAHGVHDWEIEEALADRDRWPVRSLRVHDEVRVIVLGRSATSGKYLRVVYTPRTRGSRLLIRPISAVEMSSRELRQYGRGR